MSEGARGVIAYARALERHLERFHEPPFVLSPRDFALAEEWHGLGIPLDVVVEALEAAAARRPRGNRVPRPLQLARVKADVEESWAVIRQGRLRSIPQPAGRGTSDGARELWERAAARAGQASPLGRLLLGILERLRAGEDAARLDERADVEIRTAVPQELLRAVEREVDEELAAFRGRWEERALEAARQDATRSRLRRRLGLPRLAPDASRRPPEPRPAK